MGLVTGQSHIGGISTLDDEGRPGPATQPKPDRTEALMVWAAAAAMGGVAGGLTALTGAGAPAAGLVAGAVVSLVKNMMKGSIRAHRLDDASAREHAATRTEVEAARDTELDERIQRRRGAFRRAIGI